MIDYILTADSAVIGFINSNITSDYINVLFNIFTIFGYHSIGWIAIFVIFLIRKNERRFWIFWGISFLVTFLVSDVILKNITGRERPFIAMAEITINTITPSSYSFPSSHAAFSGASFCLMAKMSRNRNLLVLMFFLSVMVALSRLFLKVHYPSDVIAGYLLGIIIVVAIDIILNRVSNESAGIEK
jgi:undecaprenyl-diphosphatase